MARCTTTSCPREAVTMTGKCKTCYAYFRYWYHKNSPAAIEARRAQIGVWSNRLTEMLKPRSVRAKVKKRARA